MTNFGKPLEEHSEEELSRGLNNYALDSTPTYMLEILRRRLKDTEETIKILGNELISLNKTIKKSNKTNEKFSIVLIFVALLQLLIAFAQLIVPFLFGGTKAAWEGVAVELILLAIILWAAWKFGLLKK